MRVQIYYKITVILQYKNGNMANLHATLRAHTKTEAFIYGDKGAINIHSRWHEGTSFTLQQYDKPPQEIEVKKEGKGYTHETREVVRCLNEGLLESPLMPHSFSRNLIKLLDAIRKEK